MDAATLREVMRAPTGEYSMNMQRANELIPHYNKAMLDAGITNVKRSAMFAAQLGCESSGLLYMKELGGDSYFARYNNRADLGNGPTDGPRYPGRGPIQVTGRYNYRNLSKWAFGKGLCPTATYFEDSPWELEKLQYGFLGAVWYWTTQRPLNTLSDNGDILGATRAINGGTNGLQNRTQRYNKALTLGDRLLPSGKATESAPMTPPKVYHPLKQGTYTVSSGYGPRWGTFHAGLDFAANLGTPIYAPADGVVIQGKDRAQGSVSGFGSWIWLDCQNSVGRDFIFGHVQWGGIKVRRGDRVKAGQVIGTVGNEGQSTGPHLHFEVYGPPGWTARKHEDPAPWLAKNVNNGNTGDASPAPSAPAAPAAPVADQKMLQDIHRLLTEKIPALGDRTLVDSLADLMQRVEWVEHEVMQAVDQLAGPYRDEKGNKFAGWDSEALLKEVERRVTNGEHLTMAHQVALLVDSLMPKPKHSKD